MKQDWALEQVEKWMHRHDYALDSVSQRMTMYLLKAERARARRIVRAYRKELHREWVKDEWDRELLCGVCDEILQRLG